MKTLAENLMSPEWWITAVFLSLILSVLGAYLVRFLDHGISKFTRWKFSFSEAKKKEHTALVQSMIDNPERMSAVRHNEIRMRINMLLGFITCSMGLLLSLIMVNTGKGQTVPLALSCMFLFVAAGSIVIAVAAMKIAFRLRDAIYDAEFALFSS